MPSELVQVQSISRLPKEVVEKIAAGEVIERPANIIKELVENSLDAGATSIEVDFDSSGRYLRVLDNGWGIENSQLNLALERHATSKIVHAEDLWRLTSFGFRGEALASIAAVSHVRLTSRTEGQEASRIVSEFGSLSEPVKASLDRGTEIVIQNLFENVPARLKFLKSEAAEFTQIKKVLRAFALMWPEVSFKIKQRNELFAFWPRVTAEKRVEQVLGSKLNYVENEYKGIKVRIFYSSPTDVENTTQQIMSFVQKRWVQDKTILAAVMEAYRNLLMHGEYPRAVVDVQIPTDEVDVNIHPTKAQVKFLDNSRIFLAVQTTLRNALEKSVPRKEQFISESPAENLQLMSDGQVQFRQKLDATETTTSEPTGNLFSASTAEPQLAHWSQLQVLGQSHLTYIVAQSRKSLILVDQHASHERVVFERLMGGFKEKTLEVQNFLLPLSLVMEADHIEAILSVKDLVAQIGLDIDALGPESISVRSAPAILKESAIEKALIELARQRLEAGESFALEKVLGDIFATMACHSVVRAGQSLSHEEMKSLLSQMDEFPFSAFCPHGRPVYIEYPVSQIEKEFGRIL